jgi:hypothetical protein
LIAGILFAGILIAGILFAGILFFVIKSKLKKVARLFIKC